MSRLIFGCIVPITFICMSVIHALQGDFGKGTYFAILAFGNAIMWNMQVRK